jgi:hypothetical protein
MAARAWVVAGLSMIGASVAMEPAWRLARPSGDGCWPPDCKDGQVPLATPVVTHAGKLFMIGDGAAPTRAHESTDGKQWRGFDHDARWGARYRAALASFGGAIWLVGGFVQDGPRRIPMNDVWRSVDGRRWERVLASAPWAARVNAHLVAFRDTLWLVGGEPNDGSIWLTTDGRNWSARRTTSLPTSNPQGVLAYRDSLWILGHGEWQTATNDVWKSSDGAAWMRVTRSAAWEPRTGAGFAVLGDRLWVIAGAGHTDAWFSTDGRDWRRIAAPLPGPPRAADYSVVFQDAFWVFGGKTGGAGGTGFWDGVAYLK